MHDTGCCDPKNESPLQAVCMSQGAPQNEKAEIKNAQPSARKYPEKLFLLNRICGSEVNIPHFALNFKEKSAILKNLLIMTTDYVNNVMYTKERIASVSGLKHRQKHHIWCECTIPLAKSCFCRKTFKSALGKCYLPDFVIAGILSSPFRAMRPLAAACGEQARGSSCAETAQPYPADPNRRRVDKQQIPHQKQEHIRCCTQ